MKHNVLLIKPTIRPVGVEALKKECNVIIAPDGEETTLISYINEHNIHAVCTRVEQITAKILESSPSLVAVGQHGVGVDNIDTETATRLGIAVINVLNSNYVSVAEHAMLLILACARRTVRMDRYTRQGDWQSRDRLIPNEVMNKKVLIAGMGRQGQEMALKLKAFHMKAYGYDPFIPADVMARCGVTKAETLQEVLADVDFVSVHVPLTPETRHMFGAKEFAMMKDSACIVNVGRGPVIDQAALTAALKNGEIAGAGLDVFDREPPAPDDPLFGLDNVIVSPHLAGDTIEAKDRCSEYLAADVLRTLKGQTPEGLYNKNVLACPRFLNNLLPS